MNLELIKTLCSYNKEELKQNVVEVLRRVGGYSPFVTNDFIVAEGNIPIVLIAHVDTVFRHTIDEKDFLYDNRKGVLWSPKGSGFDDRAGIAIILEIISQTNLRPHIIFTDGEELGGIGAHMLVEKFPSSPFNCMYLIQLDRANKKDSVYYECDNKKFEKYINKYGFETAFGTFTDISIIAPAWEIAAVNLSVGYLDEHTASERLYCKWCNETKEKVIRILTDVREGVVPKTKFEYVPAKKIFTFGKENIDFTCECLLCNKQIKSLDKAFIIDENFYNVLCEDCYSKYYKT